MSLLVNTIQLANRAIYQYNQQENANMGTTVTAVLFEGTTAYVANVGPSQVVKLLIQAALAGGGNDNVSIVVVYVV